MDGILLVNKDSGPTSFKVVKEIKKKMGFSKVGHTGTLDPFATGLLILLINRATKLSQIYLSLPKTYAAVISFGEERDTDDITGKIINKSKKIPSLKEIQSILPRFTGNIEQKPPVFSALKIKGKRAYKLARKGIEVPLEPRKITINDINISRYSKNELSLRIYCSSGTYIRALARDIGRSLDTYAFLKVLDRIAIGDFHKKNAKSIEELSINDFMNIDQGTFYIPPLVVKEETIKKIKNGVPFQKSFLIEDNFQLSKDSYYKLITKNQNTIAILKGKSYIFINKIF